MIGETGERKSAVATPDGKSRKKGKIRNRSGPKIDPCGTPVDICIMFDFVFRNSTNCCLFSK